MKKYPIFAAPVMASLLFASLATANAAEDSLSDLVVPESRAESASVELTEEQQYQAWAQTFVESLERKTGRIELPNGVATLTVPENFYYLSPKDANKVLVDAWGNPPGADTLGMLFPAEYSPVHPNAWGVTIEYEEEGYVSDEGAEEMDYSELLKQMQEDTASENEQRVAAGYQPIELLGWAAQPYYNKATHKMYWAQELRFGEGEDASNTLNYNIRMLGRKGVLVINFIAGMEQLPEIESNLNTVLAIAEFDEGSRYADFDPDIDTVAAYGLGALVAGKVLAKTGMLAVALLALKKFWIVGLIAIGGIFSRVFKGKKKDQA